MARKKLPDDPRDFANQTDDYILSVVTEDVKRAEEFCQPFIAKFSEYNDAYNAVIPPEKLREEGANLAIPYIYSTVETALPKIINSIFDSKPYISYKPVSADDGDKAKMLTQLVDYQMRQKMKAASVLYTIFKSALIEGTAISKQTWKYETKKVVRRLPTKEMQVLDDGTEQVVEVSVPQEVEEVVYDAPKIAHIPLGEFLFDPAYSSIEASPFGCHVYYMELHELKKGEKAKRYKNTKKLSTESDTELDHFGEPNRKGNMRDGVLIWEYWTDDWKVMIANKSVVVQAMENPYFHKSKPFTKWTPIPVPGAFYGKSMVESLIALQHELNTLRSQRLDNVSFAINRMFLINRNAEIDTKQLRSRPNGFIEVDDIQNDIREMVVADVTGSAYRDEEVVKADMDVTSGVHSYDRGQNPVRRDTATVASLLTSASSERFKLQAIMLEEDPLTDVGRHLAELNNQFLSDETFIAITNEDTGEEELAPITFEDIDIQYDVAAVGTAIEPSVNKEVRQSQLIQLLNVAASIPGVNTPELMKEIFQAFEFKNASELVKDEEQMAMEMQAQGMGGGVNNAGMGSQMGGVGGLGPYLQQTPENF
jgi:hypothetical protein